MATDPISEIEIPIWVKGTQKWVTGLTKRTTCDDVIYALLYQDGITENVNTSAYAIFEKWREVERPLQGRTKIVKIWRIWGAEQANVHLSMRRIDELEYSGEFSLQRRKKRSRHRTRERERDRDREKDRKSRDHRHHHGYCQNASERLRSMETLVKLVISQERNLKDMIEHGDDTDKLIDKYESRLHAHRLKQNGQEYTKDSYLEDNDDMEEFFSTANVEELEIYVSYCDKILALEDRIKCEHSNIEDLAYQIQTIANERDAQTVSQNQESAGPVSDAEDIAKVQVDLNRAVSCAIMQQYKYQDLQRELQFYEEKLNQRDDLCMRLQQELDEVDGTVMYKSNESVDSVESTGSSTKSNPLPLPERSNRVQMGKGSSTPPPLPERTRHRVDNLSDTRSISPSQPPPYKSEVVPERKPILKTSGSDTKNGHYSQCKQSANSETKVRFKTDDLIDKYCWEESSLSEGISIDQSDCSDSKDWFDYVGKKDEYSHIKSGYADRPYLTVKIEDPDSNSDTGLSSMHSDDSAVYHLETLV